MGVIAGPVVIAVFLEAVQIASTHAEPLAGPEPSGGDVEPQPDVP